MSCLVMNPEPLAAIANAVETRLNCNYDFWGFEAPDSLYRELRDCYKPTLRYCAEDIYRKLYALNVRAYSGRYSSHEEPAGEETPDVDISCYIVHRRPEYQNRGNGTGTTFAVRQWHYQLAQLLDFWLYQTAEDTTRNDPLRLAMAEFRDSLYSFIVQHSPQYTALQWGRLTPPYTPNKTGYQRSEETEHLILEPDNWEPGEWATLCKLMGHLPPKDTERIVISGYTLETFVSKKEGGPHEGGS